ncbi:MAG TPA: hypothetical protein VLH81_04895, partial [Desulfobacterales bacterium]|nr:hypothetical protein [Desulfobacterales bacterium]
MCGALSPDFAFVESWRERARATCEVVAECGTVPFWVVRGPLGAVAEARGWSDTLAATVREPEVLAAALDEALDAAVASVRDAVAGGAGAVVAADDLAGATGPLVAPDYALEEVLPRLGRLSRAAAVEGLPLVWHS